MRKLPLFFATFVLGLLCQPLASRAAATASPTPIPGTVSVSVPTDGYSFTPEIGSLIGLGSTGTKPLPPQGIEASVAIANHTTDGIRCALSVTGTPGQKFEFQVIDSKGNVAWTSLPAVSIPLEILETLKAGETWHGSAFVPLFINGVALPAGTYTLQASLFGSPTFSATTSFVVQNVIAIN